MPMPAAASAQLPFGVQDRIFEAAERKRRIEKTLERVFEACGYREVITPTFENYDVFARGMDAGALSRVYRFFDPDGRLLALRADATSAVARLAAGKLAGRRLPIRVRYAANIFRREPPHAGKFAEFTQAGVECLGGRGIGAEVEVLTLAARACRALGLARFQINLGHVGFAPPSPCQGRYGAMRCRRATDGAAWTMA
ncbi:MAG: ATP phosphoribosyltransferase regulatory subunit [Planctomycetes bacterium]|nr:ATP phosphoribosyltransferase regulatory subunit [Planctomycetota bacterium]